METANCNSIFQYSFSCGCDRPALTLKTPINVEEMRPREVPEFCARLINFHNLPCFVETGLVASLKNYVGKEITKLNNEKSSVNIEMIRKNPDLISNVAKAISEKYKKTFMIYADSVTSSKNELAQAYHYLIHSVAMPIILKLETKYRNDLTKLIQIKDQCVVNMQERQQLEMTRMCENVGFAYTNQDVTDLASKHLADTEMLNYAQRLNSQLESDYSSTIQNQRREFHEAVINLYHEMKKNKDGLDDAGPAFNKVKHIIDEKASITLNNYRGIGDDSQSQFSSPDQNSGAGSSGILMEESFTINLGAQLKTMHNVRLLVTDILNFCRYFDEREAEAQRFQSAMSLYSNSLSAVIIFADKRLRYMTGIQKEFSTICQSSNEFHFQPLTEQLKLIENEAVKCGESTSRQDEGYLHLQEGDFYITKHSNLSQVHVVFHVVVDESSLQTKTSLSTVTSRHPVITSLRQILKVCSSHDISTLTLPLLLTHELTEEITFQWCIKRAELVMKCVKGFMMEMATWDGGVSRTIQFVVPPGISEEAFDSMRLALPEVFRTTSTRNLTRSRSSK